MTSPQAHNGPQAHICAHTHTYVHRLINTHTPLHRHTHTHVNINRVFRLHGNFSETDHIDFLTLWALFRATEWLEWKELLCRFTIWGPPRWVSTMYKVCSVLGLVGATGHLPVYL